MEPQLVYRFNRGVPNQVTYRLPEWSRNSITQLSGLYLQDQYTRGRLTLSGALRWDRASSYAPVDGNGVSMTSKFNAAPISIEKTTGVDAYNDLTPRVGVAYDLFGNGKTALKLRWGRYLGFASNDPPFTSTNPAATLVASVSRNWTDTNNNKVVDCDLLNNAAQTVPGGDTCGVVTGNSANFGKIGAATIVDPKLLSGWGVRTHDYQTEVTLQQEVLPRVSAQVGYNHRTFHGFFVTQDVNRNVAADYAKYTITAPKDSRLPDGGGYPVTVYVATTTGAAQNFLTPESTYASGGEEHKAYYDGVNFDVNARLRGGVFGSVGTQTGRRVDDRCDVQPFLTGGGGPNPHGCVDANPWQTTVRGLASYTVPKIDVVVSATFRSQAPLELNVNWQIPNATLVSMGGVLAPGALPTGNTTVAIVGTAGAGDQQGRRDTNDQVRLFAGNRRTQIDMRFAKVLRFGRTRTDIGVDLWNLLNTNYATAYEDTYTFTDQNGGTWNQPTAIYPPRFVRLNFTVNF
jgi:hypothetical protein